MDSRWSIAASECTATAFLLIAVVGSGIAAERLCGGNVGLALLANAIVTGCALVALILSFGPVSGAHMNPIVTLAAAGLSHLPWRMAPFYIVSQCIGAVVGVWIAHLMFDLPVIQVSQHARTGTGIWWGEIVATVGLLGTVLRCQSRGYPTVATAVATYITGAYWFTSSTSLANPAVTLARSFTNTFAGIAPADVPYFVAAQLFALCGIILVTRLLRASRPVPS